jgi:hypothetical protein
VKVQSRRCFLQGMQGALLALPLLPSLLPRTANAKPAQRPLRFIAIKSYSTQRLIDWYPRFSGNGYQARPFDPSDGKADGTTVCPNLIPEAVGSRAAGSAHHARSAPLRDLAAKGSLSPILGLGFKPFLDDMLLLRGLDFMPDTSHNDGGMLGNYAGATVRHSEVEEWPTVDQVLAFSKRVYPETPLGPRSLHLSLGQRNTCSFSHNGVQHGKVVQVQAHIDPSTAFRDVFAQSSAASRLSRRRLVDQVIEDYRTTRVDPRLGATDRDALEQHLALLHELEARLQTEPARECRAPQEPQAGYAKGVEVATIARTMEQMVDLLLAAIRCDLTRVFTLDVWQAIARGAGPAAADLGYAHSAAKGPRDWHDRAHEFGRPEADAQVRAINQWIGNEVVLRVLDGLRAEEQDGESYLQRSVIFWGNELGMNHHNYSVPALLVGQLGGALRTGSYIDYIDWDRAAMGTQEHAPLLAGVPHNRLLVALLQGFGLTPEEYERDGQPGYGSYKTTGKSLSTHPLNYDAARYGDPLPGIRR